MNHQIKRYLIAVLALGALYLVACKDANPASDVTGNYDLTWDNVLDLKLKVGGAVYQETATSAGQTVTFNGASAGGQPVSLDLNEFCTRTEVQCPSETLWTKISVDQPKMDSNVSNSHVLNVINDTVHELPAGQHAEVRAGWVDQNDGFLLALGAGGTGGGQQGVGGCALLALSIAGGRFSHEGETVEEPPALDAGEVTAEAGVPVAKVTWDEGAPVDGIKEGQMAVGYLGGCAFGPILVGASLEIRTGFTAVRTGDFDPPPFEPLDPEEIEEGIVDGGGYDFGQPDA
jgi:hypothetical protein